MALSICNVNIYTNILLQYFPMKVFPLETFAVYSNTSMQVCNIMDISYSCNKHACMRTID